MSVARATASKRVSEQYVDVDGARLYVREVGAGKPLVVLHGGPDFNHSYLLPELDDLAPPLRLVYYDQRGRGRSRSDVEPTDVSVDSEIADLERLRRYFGFATLTLLGHSFGALLALEYAARLPHRVGRLILMNAAPASHAGLLSFRQYRQWREGAQLERIRDLAATPAYADGDIAADARYYALHFAAAVREPDRVGTIVARLRRDFTPAGILEARAIERRLYEQTWLQPGYDLIPRLACVDAPALVIHGSHDFVPIACVQAIAQALGRTRVEVLQDCGQFAYFEQPTRVRELITAFVARP